MSEKQDPPMAEGPIPGNPAASLEERLKDPAFIQEQMEAYERASIETKEAYEELLRRIQLSPTRRINPVYYYISGAAAAVLLAVAGYFMLQPKPVHAPVDTLAAAVPPARYGATLQLSDGRSLPLDAGARGVVATEAGNSIGVTPDGTLTYVAAKGASTLTNTLTTTKGQRFHVVLPDGSQVWLNAGSRLSYFSRMGESDAIRKVQLDGEGYFEVAHDKNLPFHVVARGTETVVLGTVFDVKAYSDEAKVTVGLVNGAVQVEAQGKTLALTPGQVVVSLPGRFSQISDPDVEKAVAWKQGYFYINGTLDEIAREIGRWYNVDIALKPGAVFSDTMLVNASREISLDSLLHRLEIIKAGHLTLDGRTVTVAP
ncbi:MAG TPA: FecR domain-containing protein [Dinghuibacter sp.]|uniref:FecR family protein n=1 Tax=Dinghuibacter sp. TaxID=2024697 RepID=UPI002B73D06A|nr:FecR domain-containing protein [Dinghuibacter sp.]HTJ13018.1 FecR domain-containing protein [Dinghuibacter sp.]